MSFTSSALQEDIISGVQICAAPNHSQQGTRDNPVHLSFARRDKPGQPILKQQNICPL